MLKHEPQAAPPPADQERAFTFSAGTVGQWRIDGVEPIVGPTLPAADRLLVQPGHSPAAAGVWSLRGVRSNLRYTTAAEYQVLQARQSGLDRPEAVLGVLIPIRKNAAWWALAQDERRRIYEEQSKHTTIGLEYLPNIARRLYHSRDLGEPFDFLTWFEFAPEHKGRFDELLERLRDSPEWEFVEREVELRLRRAD